MHKVYVFLNKERKADKLGYQSSHQISNAVFREHSIVPHKLSPSPTCSQIFVAWLSAVL